MARSTDLTALLKRNVTKDEINGAIKAAADGPLKGILEYATDPLVSSDIIGNPHSSIFVPEQTLVIGGNLVKIDLVVRQRVGILMPDRRTDRPSSATLSDVSVVANDRTDRRRTSVELPGRLHVQDQGTTMAKQTIRDLDVTGKKVLVRVDFNVPQTADGGVADDRRIASALPTLNDDPRPWRQPDPRQPPRTSHRRPGCRRPVPARQGGRPASGADRPAGQEGQRHRRPRGPGGLRRAEARRDRRARERPVQQGREEGRSRLRQADWPALADVYVNDAFGTCHRDEASMVAVPEQFPPDRRAIGFLVEKELQILDTLLRDPQAPVGRGDGRGQGLRQDPA